MKKKTVKKLELAKETVRGLEKAHLEQVAGGGTIYMCYSGEMKCKDSAVLC